MSVCLCVSSLGVLTAFPCLFGVCFPSSFVCVFLVCFLGVFCAFPRCFGVCILRQDGFDLDLAYVTKRIIVHGVKSRVNASVGKESQLNQTKPNQTKKNETKQNENNLLRVTLKNTRRHII